MRHFKAASTAMTGSAIDLVGQPPTLDSMRQVGDGPADAAILYWKETKGADTVGTLAQRLIGFQFAPEIDWLVDALLIADAATATRLDPRQRVEDVGFPAGDPERQRAILERGQQVFQEHGLKILLILACYSLPAAYSAQKGVRVLHADEGTGFMVKDLNRRLIETTQFVIEVFSDSGLAINTAEACQVQGPAIKSALRVRLLHAAVRAMIEGHRDATGQPTWDAATLGRPANQEDLAGTLMTFSWIVLDGLKKMHVRLTPEQEAGYFDVWKRVGRLLGVELIPETVADAKMLTDEIRARQIDGPIQAGLVNDKGINMTGRLVAFIRERFPWPLKKLPLAEALLLFFLPHDPVDVPASLGIQRTPFRRLLVRSMDLWFRFESWLTNYTFFHHLNRLVFVEWGQKDPRAFSLLQFSRNFGRRLLRGMTAFDRTLKADSGDRKKFALHDFEHKWALDQYPILSLQRTKRLYAWVTKRPYEIKV